MFVDAVSNLAKCLLFRCRHKLRRLQWTLKTRVLVFFAVTILQAILPLFMLLKQQPCKPVASPFQTASNFSTMMYVDMTSDVPVSDLIDDESCLSESLAHLAAFSLMAGLASLTLFLQISIFFKLLALLLSTVMFVVLSPSTSASLIVCFFSLVLVFIFHQVRPHLQHQGFSKFKIHPNEVKVNNFVRVKWFGRSATFGSRISASKKNK